METMETPTKKPLTNRSGIESFMEALNPPQSNSTGLTEDEMAEISKEPPRKQKRPELRYRAVEYVETLSSRITGMEDRARFLAAIDKYVNMEARLCIYTVIETEQKRYLDEALEILRKYVET